MLLPLLLHKSANPYALSVNKIGDKYTAQYAACDHGQPGSQFVVELVG